MNQSTTKNTVLCFGEVLWDCLPRGLFMGGAPINVAYHVQQFQDFSGFPVTAVGGDFLGREILRRLKFLGLETAGIHVDSQRPTGAVIVELSQQGNASYQFLENSAWDNIEVTPDNLPAPESVAAIVYGTLAFREERNRGHFDRLIKRYPDSIKVLDVNFRPPYDDLHRTRDLAQHAGLIKLNHDELARLTESTESNSDMQQQARKLSAEYGGKSICVTAGSSGAGFLDAGRDEWHLEQGREVQVVDTVGAGDSFLAAFLVNRLKGNGASEALRMACRLGEYVAGCDGATPEHPDKLD